MSQLISYVIHFNPNERNPSTPFPLQCVHTTMYNTSFERWNTINEKIALLTTTNQSSPLITQDERHTLKEVFNLLTFQTINNHSVFTHSHSDVCQKAGTHLLKTIIQNVFLIAKQYFFKSLFGEKEANAYQNTLANIFPKNKEKQRSSHSTPLLPCTSTISENCHHLILYNIAIHQWTQIRQTLGDHLSWMRKKVKNPSEPKTIHKLIQYPIFSRKELLYLRDWMEMILTHGLKEAPIHCLISAHSCEYAGYKQLFQIIEQILDVFWKEQALLQKGWNFKEIPSIFPARAEQDHNKTPDDFSETPILQENRCMLKGRINVIMLYLENKKLKKNHIILEGGFQKLNQTMQKCLEALEICRKQEEEMQREFQQNRNLGN